MDVVALRSLILGAIMMGTLVAGLFFLRFWWITRDRFFSIFAIAFFIDALSRAILGLSVVSVETEPFFYVARLISYSLILVAIVDKNRQKVA